MNGTTDTTVGQIRQSRIELLFSNIESILSARYSGDKQSVFRETLATSYIASALSCATASAPSAKDKDSVSNVLAELAEEQYDRVENQSLYFATEELVYVIVGHKIKHDAIKKEEGILYIQDRLQRDDFRRVASFDPQASASYKTYITHVINNLLIDFVRMWQRQSQLLSNEAGLAYAEDLDVAERTDSPFEQATQTMDQLRTDEQIDEFIKVFLEQPDPDAIIEKNDVRQRLRETVSLTAKEKVFLRALFQYEMNINQVRQLPGFNYSVNEAYSYYNNIIEKIAVAFRKAGVFHELRDIFSPLVPKIKVREGAEELTKYVTDVVYLQKVAQDKTHCFLVDNDDVAQFEILDSIKAVQKQFKFYMSVISANTVVGDDHVEKVIKTETPFSVSVRLFRVSESFKVGKSYLEQILRKFHK